VYVIDYLLVAFVGPVAGVVFLRPNLLLKDCANVENGKAPTMRRLLNYFKRLMSRAVSSASSGTQGGLGEGRGEGQERKVALGPRGCFFSREDIIIIQSCLFIVFLSSFCPK
jgi:hypothetical protein